MKIKSIYISSFGGLKNKEIKLNGNFNVIYGDNENGKTTVMNFIKMMFYGTERGSSQISKNPRKKYTPWDGGAMAGSIEFEHKGRNYRIERSFGSSNSTDKITLVDLDLGSRESVAADIGNNLFGLSCAAFERSVFVGQFGFPESNDIAEGEINSKLSNLTLTGDQSVSFDEVNKRLLGAKNNLTTKRGVGLYDKNVTLYRDLSEKLETANQSQELLIQKQRDINELRAKLQELQQKCNQLKSKIDSEQDFRNAAKLKELLCLKEKLDNLNQTLTLSDGKIIDEMFLRKIEFCLSKIEGDNQKITSKQNEIELLQNNLNLALNPSPDVTPQKAEEITAKLSSLESEQQDIFDNIEALKNTEKPKKTGFYIFLIINIALTIGGILLLNNNTLIPLGIAFIVIAAISQIISSLLLAKTKRKIANGEQELLDLKLRQNQLISLIATEKANLNAINTALNSNSTIIEKQKQRLETCKTELIALQNEKQENCDVLFSTYSSFKNTTNTEEIIASLEEIRAKATTQKEIKQNINYILKDIGNISYEEAKSKLEQMPVGDNNVDFEALKEAYQETNNQLTELASSLAALNTETKAIKENIPDIEMIKSKLSALKQITESQKEYCEAVDIASTVLTESFIEVRRSFGSVLEKKAGEIFAGITGGNYKALNVSKSFDIVAEKTDSFGGKEIGYLSSGTCDQAYLSLRLAVCELMAENEDRLPILLDDALAQYDDTRTNIALEFLKEYSKDGQIILFTCHNSVLHSAKQSGADQIML